MIETLQTDRWRCLISNIWSSVFASTWANTSLQIRVGENSFVLFCPLSFVVFVLISNPHAHLPLPLPHHSITHFNLTLSLSFSFHTHTHAHTHFLSLTHIVNYSLNLSPFLSFLNRTHVKAQKDVNVIFDFSLQNFNFSLTKVHYVIHSQFHSSNFPLG